MTRRAAQIGVLVEAALVACAVSCGASTAAPPALSARAAASAAASAPAPPPAPPLPPRPMAEVGEIASAIAPVTFTYAPEPDVAAAVRPLLTREAQRTWGALETALREADDELWHRMIDPLAAAAQRSVRHPICGDEASVALMPVDPILGAEIAPPAAAAATPSAKSAARAASLYAELTKGLEQAITLTPEKAPAALVALAYLRELGEPGPAVTDAARTEQAIALYRRAKGKASLDTPIGWLARFRLAGLLGASEAAEEYDALLGAQLSNAALRPWVRALGAHRLRDYVRAAGVFRAIALSAQTPAEKLGARTEWMVATYDAGNWREALDLALAMMRDPAQPAPHAAVDVAALAMARLGGVEKVSIDLPAASFATLMQHAATLALRDGDTVTAERAARKLLDHAGESAEAPGATWVLASMRALHGEVAEAEALVARRSAFAPRSAWGDRLRATRARAGFPTDEQIERLAATLTAPLPHPPSTDEERLADAHARAAGLSARCLAHPVTAGDPGADGARVDVTVRAFADRAPEVAIAPMPNDAPLAPARACLVASAPRFFRDAPASAHVIYRVSR